MWSWNNDILTIESSANKWGKLMDEWIGSKQNIWKI